VVAISSLWAAWWLSWIAAAIWSARTVQRAGVVAQTGYRVLVAIGVVGLFRGFRNEAGAPLILWRTPVAFAWAMTVLVFAGLLFTWWARLHLGRLWSGNVVRKEGHRVIDTGPYALVRHPIYTGIIFASVATAAASGSTISWIGAAIMTAGWVVKARLEEKFLRDQLGAEAYDEYAGRVPMLIPWTTRRGPS
jgi:protein-S-isoprenylcysteine O-methyltransferase Ste14